MSMITRAAVIAALFAVALCGTPTRSAAVSPAPVRTGHALLTLASGRAVFDVLPTVVRMSRLSVWEDAPRGVSGRAELLERSEQEYDWYASDDRSGDDRWSDVGDQGVEPRINERELAEPLGMFE